MCERRRSGGLAVDLGALEGAVRANFCVFEKSLLKLIWIIGNINNVEDCLSIHLRVKTHLRDLGEVCKRKNFKSHWQKT